jgi:uncharacterized protein YcsI (UPF0317 family)
MSDIEIEKCMTSDTAIQPGDTKQSTKGQQTGEEVRLAARRGVWTSQTSGAAPTYVQANLIVLPSRYASDFRLLCKRNPVPCPLLAESASNGCFDELKSCIEGLNSKHLAGDIDIRHDFPRYNVYQNGVLAKSHCGSIEGEWTEDSVGFIVGCSFSFEAALAAAGLTPTHMQRGRNVPMYRTSIPLCPAGVFQNSTYIVSMRPYRRKDIGKVRHITRPYVQTHGEPIDWGWDAVKRLGINDIIVPEYGEAPVTVEGLPLTQGIGSGQDEIVPVFWGCGVTPQEAIQRANLQGTIMAHAPGYMVVLDIKDWDIIPQQ